MLHSRAADGNHEFGHRPHLCRKFVGAEFSNGERDSLIKGLRLNFNIMRGAVAIDKRDRAPVHGCIIVCSPFVRPAICFGRLQLAFGIPMKNWKGFLAGVLLVGVGLAHVIWPQKITLDWPSVTLIIAGMLLCFAGRVSALLPYIKKLKVGEAEIELQEKLGDLRENIKQLDEKGPLKLAAGTVASERAVDEQYDLESRILELAVKDREAALIRLSIEIEKELAQLCREIGKAPSATWRRSVDELVQANIIESPLAKTLIEFRDVRNQVIHSGLRRPVKQQILLSAIDDGLIILRHLKALAKS
jgi:uncharacterized protein YutE (UPF0331/DUF86 family)